MSAKTPNKTPSKAGGQITLRLDSETIGKVERIATVNHLSVADVLRLALRQSIPAIEKNGLTILKAA